jgi:acyl-CoA-dependent ceramide synthase
MLKYIGWQKACDVGFAAFVVSWVVTRHGIYGWLCYVAWSGSREFIPWRWDPAAGYFWSPASWAGFQVGLLGLQALLLLWLWTIAKTVWNVIKGKDAGDDRSECVDAARRSCCGTKYRAQ